MYMYTNMYNIHVHAVSEIGISHVYTCIFKCCFFIVFIPFLPSPVPLLLFTPSLLLPSPVLLLLFTHSPLPLTDVS